MIQEIIDIIKLVIGVAVGTVIGSYIMEYRIRKMIKKYMPLIMGVIMSGQGSKLLENSLQKPKNKIPTATGKLPKAKSEND